MAKASKEPTRNKVYFKVVMAELAATGRFSDESSFRRIVRCCAEERVHWGVDAPPDPPPLFWKGHISNFSYTGSDVTNGATIAVMPDGIGDLVSVTLEGVSLDWDDVRKNICPDLSETPSTGGLAAAVRQTVSSSAGTQPEPPQPESELTAQKWFDNALKTDPQKPDEMDADYITRLYKKMHAAGLRRPWSRKSVSNQLYKGRQHGERAPPKAKPES